MTAHLFLDKRAAKGEAPLKIAICHKERTAYIPVGVKVLPRQWDGKAVIEHPNQKELNMLLRAKLSTTEKELIKLQTLGIKGDVKEIRDRVLYELDPDFREKKEKEGLFLYRLERYASLQTKRQTRELYEWTIKRLKAFDGSLASRRFEDINTDYLKDFNHDCSDLSVNSRSILLRNIRAVFNDAIDARITECYPFGRMSIKSEKRRKKALTLEQMKMLLKTDGRQENEYRDMFLLMFYLRGINAIDLFSARWSQVVDGRLEYRRSKVGTLFSVKIEPEAMEIIKKYCGREYLLNILERNKDYRCYLGNMNDGLKHIGCKIGKYNVKTGGLFPGLSSNWARHSWASIGVNIGIPQDIISRGMGHSPGIAVTNTYIDFDMGLVDEANRKIIDALTYSIG